MAKLLTKVEERTLIAAAQAGDRSAWERIILANIGLCWKWAHKFRRPNWMDIEDLVQEGVKGLHSAIRKFDPSKGCRFSTYAVCWIRQAMQRATEKSRHHLNVSSHANSRLIKISRAYDKLTQDLGRQPSIEEVARETKLPIKVVSDLEPARKGTLSIDVEYEGSNCDSTRNGTTVHEYILEDPEPDFRESVERNVLLEEYLSILPENLRNVLIHRYGLYGEEVATVRQLAAQYGISHECIRLWEKKALDKIRKYASAQESDA